MTAALIMAGGRGRRLAPLTDSTPKPLLEVGGSTMLDRLIEQCRRAGCAPTYVSVGYLADRIRDHLGDSVQYVEEPAPMGTIGCLQYVPQTGDDLLVVNGDVLTSLDFGRLIERHQIAKWDLTVGTKLFHTQIPFGVVYEDDATGLVRCVAEKPSVRHAAVAGIYVIGPHVPRPTGRMDMPALINETAAAGLRVGRFTIDERWADVGSHSALAAAREGW